jgi:hypothetical protein
MRTAQDNETMAPVQQVGQAQPGLITDMQLLRLPEPAQRYLRYAGVVGKEPIRTVHLRQRGVMRQRPDQKWMSMEAEQFFSVNPPAFVWHGTMRLSPLVWFSATDQFSQGHGTMRIKLLSVLPLGNERGPEMDQGTMLRYLGEIAWFPTAWLSDTIAWEAINASSVKATIHQSHVSASAVLSVNEQGQPILFSADRYMEEYGHYLLTPWSVRSSAFREAGGMRIPTHFEVTWHLDGGDFTWLRGEISEIEYNQSGKVTTF